eukprot:5412437-Pyramimonas_sp.AAC.1
MAQLSGAKSGKSTACQCKCGRCAPMERPCPSPREGRGRRVRSLAGRGSTSETRWQNEVGHILLNRPAQNSERHQLQES